MLQSTQDITSTYSTLSIYLFFLQERKEVILPNFLSSGSHSQYPQPWQHHLIQHPSMLKLPFFSKAMNLQRHSPTRNNSVLNWIIQRIKINYTPYEKLINNKHLWSFRDKQVLKTVSTSIIGTDLKNHQVDKNKDSILTSASSSQTWRKLDGQ